MSPFAATRHACMVITLRSGMRRILKRRLPAHEYIKRAVETGVYRSNEEINAVMEQRESSADDLRTIMRRFRQDIVRGTSIHDYPAEYLILEQHPPLPHPPRVSKKHLKFIAKKEHPMDHLTKKYMQRAEGLATDAVNPFPHQPQQGTSEAFYRTLLGVQRSKRLELDTTLAQKPAVVQKAYAMALKHYHVQRTEGLTDEEAVQRVEELLRDAAQRETSTAQQQRRAVQQWRRQQQREQQQQKQKQQSPPESPSFALGAGSSPPPPPSHELDPDASDSMANMFGDNPRTVEGMMRWSERLQAADYKDWTVGASTALDHWIARQVLGLEEVTWQSLLEPNVEHDAALLEIGRDIVAVRESLFPETVLDDDDREEYENIMTPDDMMAEEQRKRNEEQKEDSEKSITELLETLGGLNDDNYGSGINKDQDDVLPVWQREASQRLTPEELDARTEKLTLELQEWRAKQMESPYEQWSATEREKFDRWMMDEYVTTLVSKPERGRVDRDRTRQLLLSVPPVSPQEAQDFWDPLEQEEDGAETVLDQMLQYGPPPGASLLPSAFWDLPRDQQLQRLRNLGALRPVLDDYANESQRARFWKRHADVLLAGVEMEHLVADPQGPIRKSDLGSSSTSDSLSPETRFRLEKRPYQGRGDDAAAWEKSRALFRAWNQFKAGRARFEEELFREGKLGLKYSDELDKKLEKDFDDEVAPKN